MLGRWAWVLALACVACGARSELAWVGAVDGSGGGGAAGGGPTSSSSGSSSSSTGAGGEGGEGGSGGRGGGPAQCEIVEPILEIAGTGTFGVSRPSLVRAGLDGTYATLVTAWQNTEGPGPQPIEIRHSSVDWNDWPADGMLGPSYLVDFEGGGSFAAGNDGESFAVTFMNVDTPPAPAGAMTLMTGLVPASGALSATVPLTMGDARAGFVAGDGAFHLSGYARAGLWPEMVEVQLTEQLA